MLLLAGMYSTVSGRTPPPDVGVGRVAWFDITTTNLDEAKTFYGKLFGWTFEALKGTDGGRNSYEWHQHWNAASGQWRDQRL